MDPRPLHKLGVSADADASRRQSYLSVSSGSRDRSVSPLSPAFASQRPESPISPVTSVSSRGLRPLRLVSTCQILLLGIAHHVLVVICSQLSFFVCLILAFSK